MSKAEAKTKNRLPFSAENGFWNGDMFEDWYSSEPIPEDVQLWQFLHNWEDSLKDRLEEEIIETFKMFAKTRLNHE